MSRTENSIKNIKYAIVGQALGLIISFLSRKVFLQYLSAEYLGVEGLFGNVLLLLSLADLGIGEAITFSLYKPLASKDQNRICALMQLYRKAYNIIGISIIVLGFITVPFLKYLTNKPITIPNIQIIYFLYIINTATSYFLTYKRSLIIADQKKYIATFYRYLCYILLNLFQMIILALTKNYILFLTLQIICTYADNKLVSRKANKIYPYITKKEIHSLNPKDKEEIINNIKAMTCLKIGGVIVGGTDNIVMSKLIGVITVGIYANYYIIIKALNTVTGLVFLSLTASIGNLGATQNPEKSRFVFRVLDFVGYWIFGFCSVCLLTMFNPFIRLWVGEEYLFPLTTVIPIIISFFLTGIRQSLLTYQSAYGLYWQGRYRSIIEAIVNLIFSVILASFLGTPGIFLGTIISTISVCLIIEPYILYKYVFKSSVFEYYRHYVKYIICQSIVSIVIYFACIKIDSDTVLGLMLRFLITAVIFNMFFLIAYYRSKEMKYLQYKVKSIIIDRRKVNKI